MQAEARNVPVRVLAEEAITPLGIGLEENMEGLAQGRSGIRSIDEPELSASAFYGGMAERERVDELAGSGPEKRPLFERLCIAASKRALEASRVDPTDPSVIFLIATTKGNIDLLAEKSSSEYEGQEYLARAAREVGGYWGVVNTPWVISNACCSGTQAIDTAADLLRVGHYQKALVIGGDILSAFTVSGFQAFHALASGPCRPYDEKRDGLNLGEGSGAIVLERDETCREGELYVQGGASSNDANHISGPSRTGEGLAHAIERALHAGGIRASELDHLNAHGTATLYNDEMEAKAFERVGLSGVPMNSYKGALGHTLGAAGLIESAITLRCMREGRLLPSIGYNEHGVSPPLNLIREEKAATLDACLKTSSGFGGCNAALIFKRG